jgi:type II secretory pathway pseudopilin PulG
VVKRTQGFTYIGVLLATAILTAGVGLAIEALHTTLRREREADLLHIGVQYQRAIMLYYEGSPTRQPRYPRELKDLVRDDRYPTTRRYLRKIYPDPITGAEWGIMKAPDGGIMGIHSTSTAVPLKVRGAAATYQDWKFAYVPATAAPKKPAVPAGSTTAKPSGASAAPGAR